MCGCGRQRRHMNDAGRRAVSRELIRVSYAVKADMTALQRPANCSSSVWNRTGASCTWSGPNRLMSHGRNFERVPW
jgi:hypothetical protein